MYDFVVAGVCSMALFFNSSQPIDSTVSNDQCLQACSTKCAPRPLPETDHTFRSDVIATLSKHLSEQFVTDQLNHKDACSTYVLPQQEYIKLVELRRRMMSEESLVAGEQFFQQHAATLERLTGDDAFLKYYILAVLRIETDFGRNFGTMPALRTFYEQYTARRRSKGVSSANWILRAHVVPLLRYAESLGVDPCTIYGSHSGAIGLPQFMPFNLHLTRDGDDDGIIDIFGSAPDAMASIVSFFENQRWGQRSRSDVLRRYCGSGPYARRYAAIAEEYALALKQRIEKR